MILHSKKIGFFIFTHIQKTGGSSLKNFFNVSHLPTCHNTLEKDFKILKNDKPNINLDDVFCFTILRNPWDKMVSYYFYFRQNLPKKKNPPASKMSFGEWVKFIYETKENKSWFNSYKSFISIDGKIRSDYIINFHKYNKEFLLIKSLLGKHKKVPKVNSSNHDNYKKYYNDNSIEIVKEIYKEDIEYFGYDFNKTSKLIKPEINKNKILNIFSETYLNQKSSKTTSTPAS